MSEAQRVRSQAERLLQERYPDLRGKTLDQMRKELRESPQHRQWFAKLGELHATVAWAAPLLGVEQIGFQKAWHGIDHIGLAPSGKVAVFESKFFTDRPNPHVALKQLSQEHLDSRLGRMRMDGRKEAQGVNSVIAMMAEARGIERYMVLGSYSDQWAWLYEVVDSPDGTPQVGRLIADAPARVFMGPMYAVEFGDS